MLPPKKPRSSATGGSLLANLKGGTIAADHLVEEEEEGDLEVPEELEHILSLLLSQLSAPSSVVRWVAAKSLTLITARLPASLTEEITGSALDTFSQNILPPNAAPEDADISQCSEAGWHGTLLFLASLARARSFSPNLQDAAIPWILRALTFDHKRGSQPLGSNVRDAACYVLWSLSRLPRTSAPPSETIDAKIATSLVCTALFDREIGVRRAAAAAFQEGVGRHGAFPDGIGVLAHLDFWSIGNIRGSYSVAMGSVASFSSYRKAIVGYLVGKCVGHWDSIIRGLAAGAVGSLVGIDRELVLRYFPRMLEMARDSEAGVRHGGLLAVAEVLHAVGGQVDELSQAAEELLREATPGSMEPATPTSDMLLVAYCRLVECVADGGWPLPDSLVERGYALAFLALLRKPEVLQRAGSNAIGALATRRPETMQPRLASLTEGVRPRRDDSAGLGFIRRRGHAMALGRLPRSVILPNILEIVDAFVAGMGSAGTAPKGGKTGYMRNTVTGEAEAKSECAGSLIAVAVEALGDPCQGERVEPEVTAAIDVSLTALVNGLSDYSVDSRGDVGSWVREACMRGLGRLCPLLCRLPHGAISSSRTRDVVAGILQQCAERIDRVRTCAGGVIVELLADEEFRKVVTGSAYLQQHLGSDPPIAWGSPANLFPKIMPLLHIEAYRIDLLRGIATSIGGITESLVRHAGDGLVDFVGGLEEGPAMDADDKLSLDGFFYSLFALFQTSASEERLVVPILSTYQLLLQAGLLAKLSTDRHEHFKSVLHLAVREVRRSKDPKKIMAGVNVIVGFLNLSDFQGTGTHPDNGRQPEWKQMAIANSLSFLLHAFPRIRKHAAEQLYLALSAKDMELQLRMDDGAAGEAETADATTLFAETIEPLLLETDWDLALDQLGPVVREQLEPALERYLAL